MSIINHAWHLLQEILPVFFIAVIASSLLDRFIPDSYIDKIFNHKHPAKRSFASDAALKKVATAQGACCPSSDNLNFYRKFDEFTKILSASFIGSLLPICTCGMIPLAVKLHTKGLHWKTLCAFLVAGNACSIPALILTGVMGYKIIWIRLITSILFGIAVTYIIAIFTPKNFTLQLNIEEHHHDTHEHRDECCDRKKSLVTEILEDVRSMSISFLPWILLAIAVASLVSALGSDTKLINIILQSDNIIISPLLASIIAFPFYFCAGADIPISQELLRMGVPLGTIMSFMLASPGVNFTSLMVYKQAIGWKQAWILIAVSILSAAGIGVIVSLWQQLP